MPGVRSCFTHTHRHGDGAVVKRVLSSTASLLLRNLSEPRLRGVNIMLTLRVACCR